MEDKKLLTIGIPTYNRPDKIEAIFINLSKMKNINSVDILVIDNCSDIPVSEIYKKSNFDLKNIRIMRNKFNIGGNANIMRCIEFAETEWIWILGDDDTPLENSTEIILHDIELETTGKNVLMLKYSSELGKVNKSMYFDDYRLFFNYITTNNYYSNLLFMSTCIINQKLFSKYYAKAIEHGSSFCQIYPLFISLYRREAIVYLSEKKICQWGIGEESYKWFWGTVYQDMLHNFSYIPSVTEKDLRIIGRKWLNLNIRALLFVFCLLSINNVRKEYIKKMVKNYYSFLFSFIQKIFLFPGYLFLLFLLPHGRIVKNVLKCLNKYEKIRYIKVNDMFVLHD
jgi:glycosyltransferase involved in cell wall biosynthesis